MNAQDNPHQALMAQLADIHYPEAVGFWPPSLLVILLSLLVFFAIIGACAWLFLATRQSKAQKAALKALSQLELDELSHSSALYLGNIILKRFVLTASPRSSSEWKPLYGKDWYTSLKLNLKRGKPTEISNEIFQQWEAMEYGLEDSNSATESFIKFAQHCITHLDPKLLNTFKRGAQSV